MIDLQRQRPEQADFTLDTKGLHCPLPILKTKAKLNEMRSGEVLRVFTTDPLAPLDFKSYAVRAAHTLIYMDEGEEQSEFFLRCDRN